jgi:hypothetical protein
VGACLAAIINCKIPVVSQIRGVCMGGWRLLAPPTYDWPTQRRNSVRQWDGLESGPCGRKPGRTCH